MNPLTPRALLACTIATVMLVAACASPSSNREGTPMSVEQTKQKLCISEPELARMRSYEEKKITAPSRGFEVKGA